MEWGIGAVPKDRCCDICSGQLTQTLAPLLATGADTMEQTPAVDDEYCSTEDEDSDESEEDQGPLGNPPHPHGSSGRETEMVSSPTRRASPFSKAGLKSWRNVVYKMEYFRWVHLKTVIMPDDVLSVLAAVKKVVEVSDFAALKLHWPLWKTYGGEVIDLLASLDDPEARSKAEEKRKRKAKRAEERRCQSGNKERAPASSAQPPPCKRQQTKTTAGTPTLRITQSNSQMVEQRVGF